MLRQPRRFVPALLILVAAAAIGLWGARREMTRAAEIERHVSALFHETPQGAAAGIAGVPDLRDQIGRVQADAERQDTGCSVRAVTGDVEPFGDGTATHHAIVSVDDRPVLGLRIVYAPGAPVPAQRVKVVGWWRLDG